MSQCLFDLLAFHRIPDGAGQYISVDVAFDQIILGAVTHRFHRQSLIRDTAEHNDRNLAGGLAVDTFEGLQPVAIGQQEVQ